VSPRYARLVRVTVLHVIITLVATVALLASDVAPAETVQFQSVALVVLFAWTLVSTQVAFGTIFTPYGLFAASAFMFSAGQALLMGVGLTPTAGHFVGRFSEHTVGLTLALVTLAQTWMHLGALVATLIRPVVDIPRDQPLVASPVLLQNLRWFGWAFVLISLVPNIVLLTNAVQVVMTSGYMGLYVGEVEVGAAAAPNLIALLVIPGAQLLLAGADGRKTEARVVTFLVLTYSSIQFILGARSSASMVLVAFVWLWHRVVRPIPARTLLGGAAVLMFVVFPTIFVVRGMTGVDRFNPSVLLETYLRIENPMVSVISELGGTARTIAHTLELVPYKRAHAWGEGYLYSLLTVVPNFFWSLHPTIARGVAATWMVAEVDPYSASHGGGIGYSHIAEAYLEFGWFGVPVVMFLFGLVIALADCWARRGASAARMAAMATFLAFFLRFPRDESASMVRPLVWYIALPYLAVTVGERRRAARVHPRSKAALRAAAPTALH
jgi:oligosaccharide repeat unit polymerase